MKIFLLILLLLLKIGFNFYYNPLVTCPLIYSLMHFYYQLHTAQHSLNCNYALKSNNIISAINANICSRNLWHQFNYNRIIDDKDNTVEEYSGNYIIKLWMMNWIKEVRTSWTPEEEHCKHVRTRVSWTGNWMERALQTALKLSCSSAAAVSWVQYFHEWNTGARRPDQTHRWTESSPPV